MKSRKLNKGYNAETLKYSNGLELQFHDLYSYGYFEARYVRGDTLQKISHQRLN